VLGKHDDLILTEVRDIGEDVALRDRRLVEAKPVPSGVHLGHLTVARPAEPRKVPCPIDDERVRESLEIGGGTGDRPQPTE
jgi:hypothetical protein